nr:MAG TPA: hypothetical protein [Caudoviricetes sp.]
MQADLAGTKSSKAVILSNSADSVLSIHMRDFEFESLLLRHSANAENLSVYRHLRIFYCFEKR